MTDKDISDEKNNCNYYATQDCIGCGSCLSVCPQRCIDMSQFKAVIIQENCLHCGNCKQICPVGAIKEM